MIARESETYVVLSLIYGMVCSAIAIATAKFCFLSFKLIIGKAIESWSKIDVIALHWY